MKVMISQPMNGKTEEQIRSERKSVIEKLEKMHIEVIDTVFDYNTKNINHVPVYYLAKSIEAMSNVDAVKRLQNRKRSCTRLQNKNIRY